MRAPELRILYQDEHIVAVDKPAWWVVHATRGARGAARVVDILSDQLGARVFTVHRLDRQASGVLVFARSSAAAATMADDLRECRWRKSYLALCRGVLAESCRVTRAVREGAHRRDASTDVDPVEHFCGRYTLVRARPHQGRRHQIRVHMKKISHPLIGDANHGQGRLNRFFAQTFGLQRMFLHAERLRVQHPVELRLVELACPLPAELERVLQRLRSHQGLVL